MKIFVYHIGKPRDAHANAMAADYLSRAGHFATVHAAEIRAEKFDFFAKHASARKIFLDPLGQAMSSTEFAEMLGRGEMLGQELVFLIGGAEGLPAEWRARADMLLSLSPMTLPHELARVMIAEQIYRGFAILRGLPYAR